MSDRESQQDELLAVKSILDEGVFEISESDCSGQILIDLSFPNETKLSLLVGDKETKQTCVTVDHLSPLYLTFSFVKDYPSQSPPSFSFRALWLTATTETRLKDFLLKIWEENLGLPVLYTWYERLKDDAHQLIDCPIDLAECSVPTNQLVQTLTEYDQLRKRRLFESSYFTCEVCYEQLPGIDCERISPCGHIFCRNCCRNHLSVQLDSGAIDRMACLADECKSLVVGSQLRTILGNDLYERYEQLALSRGLDTMPDLVQCPRPQCGAPVISVGADSKLAYCDVCNLPFCLECKKVFHGVAPCTFGKHERKRIVEEYRNGTAELKAKLEKRYGKRVLQSLADESMSEEWIGENTKACPHCRASIDKNSGCNKMFCSKCGTNFCWICLRMLNPVDPYKHFNEPGSVCFNLLFQGMDMDDNNLEWMLR